MVYMYRILAFRTAQLNTLEQELHIVGQHNGMERCSHSKPLSLTQQTEL